MNKKTIYSDELLSMGERVADFLPPPSELVKREPTVKVTIELTQSSFNFFKQQAKQEQVPYQRMLRNLIDAYENSMGFEMRYFCWDLFCSVPKNEAY